MNKVGPMRDRAEAVVSAEPLSERWQSVYEKWAQARNRGPDQ